MSMKVQTIGSINSANTVNLNEDNKARCNQDLVLSPENKLPIKRIPFTSSSDLREKLLKEIKNKFTDKNQ